MAVGDYSCDWLRVPIAGCHLLWSGCMDTAHALSFKSALARNVKCCSKYLQAASCSNKSNAEQQAQVKHKDRIPVKVTINESVNTSFPKDQKLDVLDKAPVTVVFMADAP